jgi:hypothetical protein
MSEDQVRASKVILVFYLVINSYLEFYDVILLSRVSKALWKTVRSLTEINCTQVIPQRALKKIFGFFPELKKLSINATDSDWSMIYDILDHPQISLLHMSNLSLTSTKFADGFSDNIPSSQWHHIRSIHFLQCQSTAEALENISSGCKGVKHFTLHGCLYVNERNISKILSEFCYLENLHLSQLLGVQRFVVSKNLQQSLKSLTISKCSFLRDIVFDMSTSTDYSPSRSFECLIFCDLSSTSIDPTCLTWIVSSSLHLEKLIVQETKSLTGSLSLNSKSLLYIDLQYSCNITNLKIDCPELRHLDIHGCLSLKKLLIKSFMLQKLDLTMLTRVCDLELDCRNIKEVGLYGCRKLKEAKVSSLSPFGKSFSTNYYHDVFLEEKNFIEDIDFIHFGYSQLKLSNSKGSNSREQNSKAILSKVRGSQFSRRSSSI